MMTLIGITAVTAFIILCTVLPFLPGPYDSLAPPLSLMAQLFGKVGLLLVPVGGLWMLTEYRSRTAGKRYAFAITALIVTSIVGAIVSLGAIMESLTLGLGVLVLWLCMIAMLLPRLKAQRNTVARAPSLTPFYLVIVPIAVALIQLALAHPVSEFSRNRAIRNSAAFIADIEKYRVANGRYPQSLVALWRDQYRPSVIGIKEYLYEPSGDAYNVLFEQASLRLGTREIVMYNPRDEQAMTSHTVDRLQLTPAQLALDQSRGHYAVHDALHPHWKYFWFD